MISQLQGNQMVYKVRRRWQPLRALAVAALLLWVGGATGCVTIPGKNNTRYHLILGFGVVAVSDPDQSALVATDMHALGMTISDRPDVKLSIGYTSSAVVTVAAGAHDVRAEVGRKPWGPLIVDTHSATLRQALPMPPSKKKGEQP